MNQPPTSNRSHDSPVGPPPDWRRPDGVAPGTWQYVHQRSIADHYDAFVADVAMKDVERKLLNQYFPPTDNRPSPTVIDLGCGTGRTAIPLAQSGYEIIAVDLSSPMLENLEKKISGDPIADRIHPVRANLIDLSMFGDQSVDHAVCLFSTLGMIQGRVHRRSLLAHAARIIRPGGVLLLHVHHRWAALREPGGAISMGRSWVHSLRNAGHEFGDCTYAYRGLEQMFMHRFSRRELAADLDQSGWSNVRFQRLSIDGGRLQGRLPIAGGFFVIAQKPAERTNKR